MIERLDLMVGVLQLAFDNEIAMAREELRSDPINVSILDACMDEFIASGDLQRIVSAKHKIAERTVRTRLTQLEARRVVRKRGSGRNTEYRATGLV